MASASTTSTIGLARRGTVALLAVLALLASLTTITLAADPSSGTLTEASGPVTWETATFTAADSTLGGECADTTTCDVFELTIDLPDEYWDDNDGGVEVQITWTAPVDDFDLYVYPPAGETQTSGQAATTEETVFLAEPVDGTYSVRTNPYQVTNTSASGTATLASEPAATVPDGEIELGEYYFTGVAEDQVNKLDGEITATWDDTAPTEDDSEIQQVGSPLGSADEPGNPDAVSWLADFPAGTLDATLEIEWWWSTANAGAAAIGSDLLVRVFADPDVEAGTGTIIGSALVPISLGPAGQPVQNLSRIDVDGTVTDQLMIQARPNFLDTGQNNIVHYDAPATPSGFREAPPTDSNVTPEGIDGLEGADPQGLAFSATVAADNQRDESEPIIDTDLDGNMIACGPTGASQAAEYASMSTDGGDQFHMLGTPPRGQIGSGGGGDCSWDFAPEKSGDRYPLAYTGLGPLTNFTASRSSDGGQTIQTTPISGETIPGVDRQWSVFVNETDVLLSYNQQAPRQVVVQKATDGGLNYGPRVPATPQNPSFPGPMEALPATFNPTGEENGRVPYFPWNDGSTINFSVSFDEGDSWQTCTVADSPGDPTLFTTADHDSAGNIYLAYGEDASYHVYVTHLTPDRLEACDEPVTELLDEMPTTNPGWSPPLQVDRNEIRTAVFPWLVASGEPGRVSVVFYGTATDGNPNSSAFTASWDVYVAQSLNLLDGDATFAQVRATTHPFHYDSICQEGLGCSISGGDRSLADFFAIDHDPVRDALVIAYDQGSKAPGDAAGQVATPAVVRQIAGPGHLGTTVDIADREPLRTGSTDPTDDAISGYSTLGVVPLPRANQPGGDFTGVEVGPQVDLDTGEFVEDGGFTVTMEVADLSDEALQQSMTAMGAQSLLWIFRFVDGYRASAAGLTYNPAQGFGAGYSEYVTDNSECGSAGGGKCIQYPLDQPIDFDVAVDEDTGAGTIRLSVPRSMLSALSPEPDPVTGYPDRTTPDEVPATAGDRMYDATAFSLGNTLSPTQDAQGFLYPLDNTPAFDFLLQGALPELRVDDASVTETDTGTTLDFTVTLDTAPGVDEEVTVDVTTVADADAASPATGGGTDYTDVDDTLTFTEGETAKTVSVAITGDTIDEDDETFLLELSNPAGAAILRGTGTGTILDDDPAPAGGTLSINDASEVEGDDTDPTMAFTVTLSEAPGTDEEVTVDWATAGDTATTEDFTADSGTLTFAEGETSEAVPVVITSDELDEGDETLRVTLSNPAGDDVAIARAVGTGTIIDDDPPPAISVDDVTVTEGDAGRSTASFTVSLSRASGRTISVDVATRDDTATAGNDYEAVEREVVLPIGATATTVGVPVLDDASDEQDETFRLQLSDPTNATLDDAVGTATIVDDDEPGTDPGPDPEPTETETEAPEDETVRLGGENRFATAVLASLAQYPEDRSVDTVVVARGDDPDGYADALAGVPLAHDLDAPLLIVLPDELPDETSTELQRVLRPGGTVVVLGGPVAVSSSVEDEIAALGFDTDRIQGEDRFATATAIAERLGNPDTLFLTTGFDFPDALTAGTAAAVVDGAVLLTGSDARHPTTDAYLDRFPDAELFAVGGPSARPHPEATAVFGPDREATAAAVAESFFDAPTAVGIAVSTAFPDALSGGPLMASLDSPILLTPRSSLASATSSQLCRDAASTSLAHVFGGEAAIAPDVLDLVDDRIRGQGC